MKFLRKFLDNQSKHFKEGGKLARLHPLYEAIDNFIYSPGTVTKSAPHVRDVLDFKRMMIWVVIALVPAVIMALYNTGLQANIALAQTGGAEVSGWRGSVITFLGTSLNPNDILSNIIHGALYFFPIYLITLAAGGFWEVLFGTIRKHPISEGFLVTSLLFPMILPPNLPWWQIVLGISFGVVIGKEIFGGVGMNILNPALTGRAFLYFAYPAEISGDAVWVAVDGVSRATPLAELADPVLELSVSFKDALIGIIPGSMGETSVIACLIGAAILIITGVGSWRTMFGSVVGMVLVALLFNFIGSNTNAMFQVNPLWHFVLGGFAFGTVFMATDPISSAHTQTGQYFYGLLIGILTVLVRVVNMGFPEGIMLAILFANVFAPVIDKIIINMNIKRRRLRSV
ncbi:MAG: NADH:ubiquinone reductase (Na(+)-transporting) subunit B [Ignavibacteriae bacterium]|nr:MAG: NADH:ubiquinone reductase (Na(+)-transporting) subunit B [Ignavibacteriota bacterium]